MSRTSCRGRFPDEWPQPAASAARALAKAAVLMPRALTRLRLAVEGGAAACRAEHVETTVDVVPPARVRSAFGLDGVQRLELVAVEAADETGVADRDVQPPQVGVVHDHVRDAGQRQARDHLAAVAV